MPSRRSPDRKLPDTAESQFNLVARTQALAMGFSESAIRKRVCSGRLIRELPNVLALPGGPRSWRRAVMGACLWAGPPSAASHRTAAALHGFPRFPESKVEISTTLSKKPHQLPFNVHRVSKHLLPEIVSVDGIPTTSPRRTLLDLAGIRDPRLGRALDHALLKDQVSLGELWLLYEEEWTWGRRGIAILRGELLQRTTGRGPTHGELARLFRKIVRDFNLPSPEAEFPVDLPRYSIHADFAYREARLLIELDGYAYHMDRETFERDRERDNDLQVQGWRILRFTWAMLRWQPERVAAIVLAHLNPPTTGRERAK